MVVFGLATRALSCTYDLLGDNIETISEGGVQRQKYYYDSLNQLIREDNLDLNKTIVYSYDLGGNITSTKEYAYQTGAAVTGTPTTTNTYTYGDSNWKDKLTSYNGNTISYDQIGNPLSYRNGWNFTWQKGRQLASAANGSTSISYTYNNDGYRTSKTVNGTTTDYTLEGDRVLIEKTGSDYVWLYYDAAGAPVAMATGSGPSLYIYRKNLQGDITGIYSGSTGTLFVSYVYDAWGKVTATDVAQTTESADVLNNNPYLYRGYRYDSETGLYYLNSRYYDPETGRFVNADIIIKTQNQVKGQNLYEYARNNVINMVDDQGTDAIYINDMSDTGHWLFGHLQIFVQDENGEWVFTEYTRTSERIQVVTLGIDEEYFPNSEYSLQQMVDTVLEGGKLNKKEYVYIKGDFTESAKYAKEQKGSKRRPYLPLFKDCVTYGNEVLLKGRFDNLLAWDVLRTRSAALAGTYVRKLKRANKQWSAIMSLLE